MMTETDGGGRQKIIDWARLSSGAAVIGLGMGFTMNLVFGVWYTSEIFYRMSVAEGKILQIEARIEDTQKVMSAAVVNEAKISVQIESLKELIDRLISREDANEKAIRR